jgi:ADP-heptose:LPS heptosyltransferase
MKLNFRRGAAFASQKARDYLKDKNPQDVKNVTVIRHAAIGDFMNIRPFLIELREFFPNAKITLNVLRSSMYGMPNDLIDDAFVMDKIDVVTGKSATLFERIRQARSMRAQDVVFDLTDSSLTLLFVIFSNSELKVGYSYRAFRRFFYDVSTLRRECLFDMDLRQNTQKM